LSLGLDLLEGWQAAGRAPGAGTTTGQPHLTATLTALRANRPVASAPDAVALALWFHHCSDLDPTLLDRLAGLGGAALAIRVDWLVRGLAAGVPLPEDAAAGLLHAAHRTAVSAVHLAPVRASGPDQ
jgi:hypothetical protein